jgi:DNA-binding beta-propeller fold protein YncE
VGLRARVELVRVFGASPGMPRDCAFPDRGRAGSPVSYSTPVRPARFNFREFPVRLLALLLTAVPALAGDRLVLFADGLQAPFGMDFRGGQLVVAEFGGHRIIALDKDGKPTVLAGSGKKGFADGPAGKAEFNAPHNLAVAPDGTIFVADPFNSRVRKIDPRTGMVTTIAGGEKGFAGDNGPAKDARFNEAYHVALEPGGKALLVCDLGNRRIRRIDLAAGTISTVAGNGKKGVPADGSVATEAPLVDPRAVAADRTGRLWILERSGNALRVVEGGKIRTVAGTGRRGSAGDGGRALTAELDGPKCLWIDPAGDVLIADTNNHCVRKVGRTDGTISRVAGTGRKGKGEPGGSALDVALNEPHGVAVGPDGTVYVADSLNGRILKLAK